MYSRRLFYGGRGNDFFSFFTICLNRIYKSLFTIMFAAKIATAARLSARSLSTSTVVRIAHAHAPARTPQARTSWGCGGDGRHHPRFSS